MTPDVTVVIPTRNRRHLLSGAMASVRRQGGVACELVVADDRSIDGTGAWLERELRGPGERVTAGRSPGRPHAANAGLAEARGRHVLFLDDDDELLDGALAKLVRHEYGKALLGVTAAGLLAYGLFCFAQARYREV
jgi:glycosyltransferase involved in cell wall biosynthesis